MGLVFWFDISFYGLSLWFPEYVKLLKGQDYDRQATTIVNAEYSNVQFNRSIENMIYMNSYFTNVSFERLTLNHVIFDQCDFNRVSFTNVKSSRRYQCVK